MMMKESNRIGGGQDEYSFVLVPFGEEKSIGKSMDISLVIYTNALLKVAKSRISWLDVRYYMKNALLPGQKRSTEHEASSAT